MLNFLSTELNRIHPIIVSFPIALLVVSVFLDLAARFRSQLHASGWITLLLGSLGTIAAVLSGIVAHQPYKGMPVAEFIEPHERMAYLTTAIFVSLCLWRGFFLWKGKDVARTWLYTILSLLGLIALISVGTLGGNLVFLHSVGVSH